MYTTYPKKGKYLNDMVAQGTFFFLSIVPEKKLDSVLYCTSTRLLAKRYGFASDAECNYRNLLGSVAL